MKHSKLALLALTCLLMVAAVMPVHADRYRRAQNDHPLRLVGYVLFPVGLAVEYVVMRPIHWVVSQPNLDILFGHQPTLAEEGTYFEWTHGDYTPSIAAELEKQREAEAARQAAPVPARPVAP